MKNIIVFVLATLLSFNLYAKDLCDQITKEDYFDYLKNYIGKGYLIPEKPIDYFSKLRKPPGNNYFLQDKDEIVVYQFNNAKLVQNIPNEGVLINIHQYSDQLYFVEGLQGIDNSTIKLLVVEYDGSYNYNSLMGIKTIIAFKQTTNNSVLSIMKENNKKKLPKICPKMNFDEWKAEYIQANSKN